MRIQTKYQTTKFMAIAFSDKGYLLGLLKTHLRNIHDAFTLESKRTESVILKGDKFNLSVVIDWNFEVNVSSTITQKENKSKNGYSPHVIKLKKPKVNISKKQSTYQFRVFPTKSQEG